MRIPVATVLAATAAVLTGAAPACAELGKPQLLTVSPLEQSDGISSSSLSANGRYLVFAGSLGGVSGVLRRDLQTGLTEPVAAADAYGSSPVRAASAPSVSADGRYVSFTTTAALDPANDHNTLADVYVRDMDASVPSGGAACDAIASGPCAYTLVSARDGAAEGLSYTLGDGATAIARQAISGDGRKVVFAVSAQSDLAGAATPAGQIAVRDLDAQRTTLVSTLRDPATGAQTSQPVTGGALAGSGAAISADGTAVTWLAAHVDLQAATVADDPARADHAYDEPLWRRVADGPSAPIRRVAGAADPEAPGCPAGGTMAVVACQGPYPTLGQNWNGEAQPWGGWQTHPTGTPSISADGRAVAFLGGPPNPPQNLPNDNTDLFVADMRDGVPRRTALRRLTFDITGAGLADLAMAPTGRRIAFATYRNAFSLTPPFLIGSPPAQANLLELWLIDLDGQTLQRLSRTVDGGPAASPVVPPFTQEDPASPSFDATGTMIAFDSPAANLVAVDRNNANDAFLVEDRAVPPGTPGRVDITPPPVPPSIPRAWKMALRAVSQRDGTVRFDATLPGTGVLRATIQATVPVIKHVKVRKRGGGHRTARRTVLSKRQIAVASTVVVRDGLTRLTVRTTNAYRTLARAKAGLDATARITFAAPGRTTLRDTVAVRFRVVSAKKATTKKNTSKGTSR